MPLFLKETFSEKNGIPTKESVLDPECLLPKGKQTISESLMKETEVEGIVRSPFNALIEAIHANFVTRNYTRYTEKCLSSMVNSWTNPYNVPVILFHNDEDGEIIGRVTEAKVTKSKQLSQPSDKCLLLTANIPEWKYRDKIESGILSTTSIGVSANDVRCSICGQRLDDGHWCEHERGVTYDGKTCYWDINSAEAKEISFVIVPSDKYSQVICVVEDTPEGETQYLANRAKNIVSKASAQNSINSTNIKESQKPISLTEGKKDALDINEALKAIESKDKEISALTGDKKSLQEKIDSLNTDKVSLQEQIEQKNQELEAKEMEISAAKDLSEKAEAANEALMAEVRESRIETINGLREKIGLAAQDVATLKERSLDSLKDTISDLKEQLASKESTVVTETEVKDTVVDPTLKETETKINDKEDVKDVKESVTASTSFDL